MRSGMRRKAPVIAAIIQERLARGNLGTMDLSNKYCVVARQIACRDVAFHLHQRVIEKRDAMRRPAETDAKGLLIGFGLFRLRKKTRKSSLIRPEQVHAEAPPFVKQDEHLRVFRDTDEEERRFQRDGSQGIGGHAMHEARGALDGDHGDAGGEMTEGATEIRGGQGSRGHTAMP